MIRRAFVLVLALIVLVHGLICLLGAEAGFGWVAVPAFSTPISAGEAVLWSVAALLAGATSVLLVLRRRSWWIAGAATVVVSQVAILTAWPDAAAGTVVNVLLSLAVLYGWRASGPSSQQSRFRRTIASVLRSERSESVVDSPLLREDDLTDLPPLVAQYVRRSGSVGRPVVTGFHAWLSGRIRGGPDRPWMAFTGEQVNTVSPQAARWFHLDATMKGLPVDVLHELEAGHATMRAVLLGAVTVMDAAGPEMDRAETVTLLNDLCVFAPGALPYASIDWEPVDDHRVRATYANGGNTVRAVLEFDEDGDLVDFVSEDRLAASPDGRTFTPTRWSTPLADYRAFDGYSVASSGQGRWHPEEGQYAYLEIRVEELTMLHSTIHRPGNGVHPGAEPSEAAALAP